MGKPMYSNRHVADDIVHYCGFGRTKGEMLRLIMCSAPRFSRILEQMHKAGIMRRTPFKMYENSREEIHWSLWDYDTDEENEAKLTELFGPKEKKDNG